MTFTNLSNLCISTRPPVDIYVRGISVPAFPAAFCYQISFGRFSFAKLHKRAQSLRATQYQAKDHWSGVPRGENAPYSVVVQWVFCTKFRNGWSGLKTPFAFPHLRPCHEWVEFPEVISALVEIRVVYCCRCTCYLCVMWVYFKPVNGLIVNFP